ncbi:MAG: hypothetical protein J07HQW1_01761 [Haloquadratum walsbyi J07HQW1]|uniref:Uncharacterized protein n=1 Tax=Haloquadratum walsbyi J07HQW1 TaxID=1238424 RepID=U1PDR0_9EURY|nr:MAG: hypothetical protein J07HQW1_01761 [Haloquadratum walsbyi J07HQW1]
MRATATASISDTRNMEIGTLFERVFKEIKRRTICFSNVKAETADDWLRSVTFAWNQLI